MRQITSLILTTLLVLVITELKAQTGNVWALGYKKGLDFTQSPPKLITTGITGAGSFGAGHSSSISDCQGKLLFYISPVGIYNKKHEIMQNGSINNGGGTTNLNLGVLILPRPMDSTRFFAFYMYFGDNKDGLYMAEIDMTANGGLGGILYRDSLVGQIKVASMNLTYAKHANDTDFWLITAPDEDHISCFRITAKGVDMTPVTNNAYAQIHFFPLPYDPNNFYEEFQGGFIGMTHDNRNLIVTGIQKSHHAKASSLIYNFDRATGKLSNERTLFAHSELLNGSVSLQVEVSPNDSIIYLVTSGHWTEKPENVDRIYQINRYTLKKRLVASVGFKTGEALFGMRLGPDGRIYITTGDAIQFLNYIPRPNVEKDCGFIRQWQILDTINNLIFSMPNNFSIGHDFSYTVTGLCSDTVVFTYGGEEQFDSLSWYFGDGTVSVFKKGKYWSGMQVRHVYAVRDTVYEAKLAVPVNSCGFISWWADSVRVTNSPAFGKTKFDWLADCSGGVLSVSDTTSFAKKAVVHWDEETAGIAYFDTKKNYTLSKRFGNIGLHPLKIELSNDYCQITLDTQLNLQALPQVQSKLYKRLRDTVCIGEGLELRDTFENLKTRSINWGDGISDGTLRFSKGDTTFKFTHPYSDSGLYTITLFDTSTADCPSADSFQVYVLPRPMPKYPLHDTTFCSSFSLTLKAVTQYGDADMLQLGYGETYNWNDLTFQLGLGTDSFLNWSKPGIIELIVTNICGTKRDTITVKQLSTPNIKLDSLYDACENISLKLDISNPKNEETYLWSTAETTPTITTTKAGQYWAKAMNYCSEDSVSFKVVLYPKPISNFSVADDCEGELVNFQNKTSGGKTFEWRFGDGTISTDSTPNKTYAITQNSRTYFVTLVVKISSNCRDSISKALNVNATSDAGFTHTSQGKTVFFTQTATESGESYKWFFGDGDSSTQTNPTHQYQADSGTYNVCLNILNAANCQSRVCKAVRYSLGIDEISKNMFSVYPNPTTGAVHIHFRNPISNANISVYNLFGEKVLDIMNITGQNITLDLHQLTSGVYLMRVNGENRNETKKIFLIK